MKIIQSIKRLSILATLIIICRYDIFHTVMDSTTTLGEAIRNIHTEQLINFIGANTSYSLVHNILVKPPISSDVVPNIEDLDNIIQTSVPYKQWRVSTTILNYGIDVLNSVFSKYRIQLDSTAFNALTNSIPVIDTQKQSIQNFLQDVTFRIISKTGTLYIIKLVWVYSDNKGNLIVQPQVYQVGLKYTTMLDLGIPLAHILYFIILNDIIDGSSISQNITGTYLDAISEYSQRNPQDRVFWSQILDELVIRYKNCLKEGGNCGAIFKQYIRTIQQNRTTLLDMLSKQYTVQLELNHGEMSKKDYDKIVLQQHKTLLTRLKTLIEPQNGTSKDPELEQLVDLLERLNSTQIFALYSIYQLKSKSTLPLSLKGITQDNGVTLDPQEQQPIIEFWNQLRPNIQLVVYDHWPSLFNYYVKLDEETNNVIDNTNWRAIKTSTITEQIYDYYFAFGNKEAVYRFLKTLLVIFIISTVVYGLYYGYKRSEIINKALLDHVTKVTQSLTGVSYIINALGAQNILAFLIVAILLLSVIILMLFKLSRARTIVEKTY